MFDSRMNELIAPDKSGECKTREELAVCVHQLSQLREVLTHTAGAAAPSLPDCSDLLLGTQFLETLVRLANEEKLLFRNDRLQVEANSERIERAKSLSEEKERCLQESIGALTSVVQTLNEKLSKESEMSSRYELAEECCKVLHSNWLKDNKSDETEGHVTIYEGANANEPVILSNYRALLATHEMLLKSSKESVTPDNQDTNLDTVNPLTSKDKEDTVLSCNKLLNRVKNYLDEITRTCMEGENPEEELTGSETDESGPKEIDSIECIVVLDSRVELTNFGKVERDAMIYGLKKVKNSIKKNLKHISQLEMENSTLKKKLSSLESVFSVVPDTTVHSDQHKLQVQVKELQLQLASKDEELQNILNIRERETAEKEQHLAELNMSRAEVEVRFLASFVA